MIEKIRRIADNPLEAASLEDKEQLEKEKLEEEIKRKAAQNGVIRSCWELCARCIRGEAGQENDGENESDFGKNSKSVKDDEIGRIGGNYNTSEGRLSQGKKEITDDAMLLEQTIVKVGALLALGFGEAGVKIISDNMGHTGDVDPMIPGNKVVAIFGFCDIRQFTDTTEVLQEDIMSYVNEIAELVHGVVDKFSGTPNKNIGDAFLFVWKFSNKSVRMNQKTRELLPKPEVAVRQLADMSVISFLKAMGTVRKSMILDKYRKREDIREKLPNYQVKLGFGLHVGWAIEGAIGSEFKIDASYISPNVNLASRLESATK